MLDIEVVVALTLHVYSFDQGFVPKCIRNEFRVFTILYSFAETTLPYSLLVKLVQLACHLFKNLNIFFQMGCKVSLSMPFYTEHQIMLILPSSTSTSTTTSTKVEISINLVLSDHPPTHPE